MRALTAGESVLLTEAAGLAVQRSHVRVFVRDAGGTPRDLTTWPGWDVVADVSVRDSADQPLATCNVSLQRAAGEASVAPLAEESPLNRNFGASGYAPLLQLGREMWVEAGVSGLDAQPIQWRELFRGYIDRLTWGGERVEVEAADLGAALRDAFIEEERIYAHLSGVDASARQWRAGMTVAAGQWVVPSQARANGKAYQAGGPGTTGTTEPTWPLTGTVADAGITWTQAANTSTVVGRQVEEVLARLAADAGVPVTVVTPVSPGWAVRFWLQDRVSVLDAQQALAQQIGWTLKYRWNSGASAWRLTLLDPGRTATVAMYSFGAGRHRAVPKAQLEVADIRNVVRVLYSDSADRDAKDVPRRKSVLASSAPSITKYGRRFCEISEEETSNIDTTSDAQRLADGVLSDLAEPFVDVEVEVPFFPFVEVHDLYAFAGDDVHWTSTQTLAVVGFEHAFNSQGDAVTRLQVRGKPSAGVGRWLAMEAGRAAEANSPVTTVLTAAATFSVVCTPVPGGVRIQVAQQGISSTDHRPTMAELHVSASASFAPSASTLKGQGTSIDTTVTDLIPGATYYAKVVPYGLDDAGRQVAGLPSAEVSFVAGRANIANAAVQVVQRWLPPNGTFEHFTAPSASRPPDHWEMGAGTWGPGQTAETPSLGGIPPFGLTRTIKFNNDAVVAGEVRSSVFGWRAGSRPWLRARAMRRGGTAANLRVYLRLYRDAGATSLVTTLSLEFSGTGGFPLPVNIWFTQETRSDVSYDEANFARVSLERTAAGISSWEVGEVAVDDARQPLPEVFGVALTGPNWVNYGGAYQNAVYRRNGDGLVTLQGLVQRAVAGNDTVGTLPAGYRPPGQLIFACHSDVGGTRVDVSAAGGITNGTSAVGGYLSLAGISFYAEQ